MSFAAGAKAQGVVSAEVAIRWLARRSVLDDMDMIISGASKAGQLAKSVGFMQKGSLSPHLVTLAEVLWKAVSHLREEIV